MEILSYVIAALWSSTIDIQTRRIPNWSILLFLAFFLGFGNFGWEYLLVSAFGMIIVRALSSQGIGFGDIKLTMVLALHCADFASLNFALFCSFMSAGIWLAICTGICRAMPQSLPMAPFLWLGFLTSL